MPQAARAALYARFSTDLQDPRSIDDQLDLCRSYAARQGYAVAGTFADRAKSGASLIGRDGLLSLLDEVKAGRIDVVVVEALDRLSRDIEDLAAVHKRITFAGARIEAVGEGVATAITVGLRGIVGQLFLADLRDKIRRGMAGRVRDGRFPGGRPYGYRTTPGDPGNLVINPEEAEIVRRIFAAYVDGVSPRDIAIGLNRDGVPPPRGARWNASTLIGSAQRENGLIRNPIYAGRIVWGRVRMVRDPETGRRVSRIADEQARHEAPAPHLEIVSPDLFARAQARRVARAYATRQEPPTRSRRLLSGLLRCGSCGGPMTVRGRDRGGVRIGCSAHHEAGTCDHGRRYYAHKFEAGVIDLLRKQLASPETLAAYLSAYREERRRAAASITRERTGIERKIADARGAISRIVDAIASGLLSPDEARPRLEEARADLPRLERRLAEINAGDDTTIELHPQAVARYRADIEGLHALLPAMAEDESVGDEIRARLASLIDRVIVRPAPPGEIDAEVIGKLSALGIPDTRPRGRVSAIGLEAEVGFKSDKRQIASFGRIIYRKGLDRVGNIR